MGMQRYGMAGSVNSAYVNNRVHMRRASGVEQNSLTDAGLAYAEASYTQPSAATTLPVEDRCEAAPKCQKSHLILKCSKMC